MPEQAGTEEASSPSNEASFILGEPSEVPAVNPGSSLLVVLRMVLVLALAALAIYGVVFFIKRLARPKELRDPHLKILARVPMGNDVFAAVISVGSKAWLVGGGSGGVNLISEINEIEALETMLLEDAKRSAEADGRRVLDFRSILSRVTGAREGVDAQGPGADSLKRQRERLKRL